MLSENRDNAVIKYIKSPTQVAAFQAILGDRNAKEFIYSVLIAVQSEPKLMSCNPESVYTCALRAATLNINVDPDIAEGYLVPYGKVCKLIIGKKGYYNLAQRTDLYRYINIAPVYKGQEVIEDQLRGIHSIEGKIKSKEIIGFIGYLEKFTGFIKTEYMTIEEIHEHAKRFSPSYKNKDGAWTTHTRAMEEKTVLRRLLKRWGELRPGDKALLEQIEKDSEIPADDSQTIEADYFETTENPEDRTANEAIAQLGFAKWTTRQLAMLVNKKIVPDEKEAEAVLNKSQFQGTEPDEDLLYFSQNYMANVQAGKTPKEAAKAAENAYQNWLKRQEK